MNDIVTNFIYMAKLYFEKKHLIRLILIIAGYKKQRNVK